MFIWLALLTIAYLTPLLSLTRTLARLPLRALTVFRFFKHEKKKSFALPPQIKHALKVTNHALGVWEYYVRAPRNILLGPAVLILTLTGLCRGTSPFFYLLLSALTVHSFWVQRAVSLRMVEFLRTIPILSPQLFFKTLIAQLGPFGTGLPQDSEIEIMTPREANFRKHERSRTRPFLWLALLWDTAHLAHMSLKALTLVGPTYARVIFDHMASMWGKRVLERAHLNLQVEGTEKIESLPGKIILVLNHKSQLDFALTFFALAQIRRPGGRIFKPRFITAKDHFLDNPVIYDWLGIGRLIEAVDMVFLERKKAGSGVLGLESAAKTLAEKEIEIAIFPQGTRAPGVLDRSGKRRDAGYYTPVSSKDAHSPLGHLKKGVAYLALDTALALNAQKSTQPVHLLFIGIRGTATVLPRQSLSFQTEADLEFHVGETLTLEAQDVEDLEKPTGPGASNESQQRYLDYVGELHAEIDRRLAAASGVHEVLKHRFLLDLQGPLHLSRDLLAKVERTFDAFAAAKPLTYQVIDRIYACPKSGWDTPLSDLAQIIVDGHGEKRLQMLWETVTQTMLKTTDVKIRGK